MPAKSATTVAPRYVARRGGFEYAGQPIDRGLIFPLAGGMNDEKLVRLGYVTLLEGKAETYRCAVCGAEFVGISERTGHGDLRHKQRSLTPEEEDRFEDRQEKQNEQLGPLYLDKTKAAQAAA
jgi:hypothetical protein